MYVASTVSHNRKPASDIVLPRAVLLCLPEPYVTTTDGQLLAVSMGVSPLAGYSGGCVQKYHYPSLMVIAFRGSQSHGRGLTPNFSVRACRPVACSLLRQRERICLMGYSVVNEQRGILSPHYLYSKKSEFYRKFLSRIFAVLPTPSSLQFDIQIPEDSLHFFVN